MYRLFIISFTLLFSLNSFTAEPVSTSYWGDKAVGGTDVLSYHSAAQAGNRTIVEGSARFKVRWNEADWYFASQQSADKFASGPERYRPRYNGFCSNALSLGEGLISTNGQVWEFFNGELHLFFAERGRQRWLTGDWQSYQRTADQAWQQALNN
ncbi:hypothetical protein M0C34_18545 [Agarivorans sp. TSD2052]|uniref:YHS domain-containing (seleno)protein n=1 Tax=Agarivorans sp. TSD2052 TaxID=2937286 RepID=UPI00200D4798|nr:YHS domain-containing (seleno)protein [Agarivorans sp. TSD2052]UPW18197.1 hypothetical protein M0C34_18545 [Agarivorans sp. TSD2052]